MTWMNNVVPLLCLSLLLITQSGCRRASVPVPTEISSLRGTPENQRKMTIRIDRATLREKVSRPDHVSKIRIVPVLRAESEKIPYPEYRLFDIKEESVYDLLGLKNADVLVSANGYVIKDARVFPVYITMLKDQGQAHIEILRNDEPLLLEYDIVG